jgi:hypothetical protein
LSTSEQKYELDVAFTTSKSRLSLEIYWGELLDEAMIKGKMG